MNTINKPDRITILAKFLPYLRLIRAFNPENFHFDGSFSNAWRHLLRDVFRAFCASLATLSISVEIMLMIWNILENDAGVKVLAISVPLLMSFVQVLVTFVALMCENRNITEAIARIQGLVSQREQFFFGSHLNWLEM